MTGKFFIGDFDPRDRGESEYTGEVGLRAILGPTEAVSRLRLASMTGRTPIRPVVSGLPGKFDREAHDVFSRATRYFPVTTGQNRP